MIYFNSNRRPLPRSVVLKGRRKVRKFGGHIMLPPSWLKKGYITALSKFGGPWPPYPQYSDSPVLLRLHNIALPIIESDANRSATSCIVQCQLFEKVKSEAEASLKSQLFSLIKCNICIIKIIPGCCGFYYVSTLKCGAILQPWYSFNDVTST